MLSWNFRRNKAAGGKADDVGCIHIRFWELFMKKFLAFIPDMVLLYKMVCSS